MVELFQGLRWAHIAAGAIALIVFWVPAIAKKGGRTHIRAGWVYVACMSIVVVSAFLMSGLVFSAPLAVRGIQQPLSAGEMAGFLREQRIFASFLGFLAGITLASGWMGIGATRTKREPERLRTAFLMALNAGLIATGVAILVFGLRNRVWPLVGLSPLGPALGSGNLFYILRKPATKMDWWYKHLGSMIGTGIAAYTAFLVFGGRRVIPALAGNAGSTVFWVLPTIIGGAAITILNIYYRRKFRGKGSIAHGTTH